MTNLARFALAEGDGVVVQLVAPHGVRPAGAGLTMPREAQLGFEEAAAKLRPIADVLLAQMKHLEADEVKLELSVRFCAELGLILARSEAEGHCRLEMMWKKPR